MKDLTKLLIATTQHTGYAVLVQKLIAGERLSVDDGILLYACHDLSLLALMASFRRKQINADKVFFNRNFHIEPTNLCVYDCIFCSYRRAAGEQGSWDLSLDDVRDVCRRYTGKAITEVHITGGVHPQRDILYYTSVLDIVKEMLPGAHIKAFTAVEIDYMCAKAGMSWKDGLHLLQQHGLVALPGGGAEIFNEAVRSQICSKKASSEMWLGVHEAAHKLGIRTNATMLFGHIEKPEHRVEHLNRLRLLQDSTGGFDAFIPLKYKPAHNALGAIGETSTAEVLRNFAVCRLMLDNIPHMKAYWPMLGKEVMQMALLYGADDVDGTINDSTRIYSMAGAEEQHPVMDIEELCRMVDAAGFVPVERDTFYNELKVYKE